MMKRTIKIIPLVFLLALINPCFEFFNRSALLRAQPESKVSMERTNIMVKVIPAKKENFTLTIDYVGSLRAKDETVAVPKVTGKIVEYLVNEGDMVKQGQVIATIERDETGLKYELAKVDAPISGIVGRILLDRGTTIEPNKTAVAIIVDMEEMVVRLNIPEQDIPYMKKGLLALIKVDAYPSEDFKGVVSRVAEMVDPQTRTLPIEITIPNLDHRLKSGMFTRIKIIAAELKNVLVLSQDAIVQELGEKFVFVVKESIANKQKVTLGKRDNGNVEILEGVVEGDRVIVFGQQGLKDGASVVVSQ